MEVMILMVAALILLIMIKPLGVVDYDPKTVTTAEAILREYYMDGINASLRKSTPLLERLQRRAPEMVGGDEIIMLLPCILKTLLL